MNTNNPTKLNRLLRSQPRGVVLLSTWLAKNGYSLDLQKIYKASHWLESIGHGAMARTGENLDYLGAIYALQEQLGLSIHPGGRTALALAGKSHYLELSAKKVVLFGAAKENLPSWFKKRDWGLHVDYSSSSFLPRDLGLTNCRQEGFEIKISGAARAIMECLYLAPKKQPLMEVAELMEGLNNLRPGPVQTLLERCSSVKVKRMFLYLAERAGHDWFTYVDLTNVNLGKGKRSMVSEGVYVPRYQITVPRDLVG